MACAGIFLLTLAPGVLIAGAVAPARRLILVPAGLSIGLGITSLIHFWMRLLGAPFGLHGGRRARFAPHRGRALETSLAKPGGTARRLGMGGHRGALPVRLDRPGGLPGGGAGAPRAMGCVGDLEPAGALPVSRGRSRHRLLGGLPVVAPRLPGPRAEHRRPLVGVAGRGVPAGARGAGSLVHGGYPARTLLLPGAPGFTAGGAPRLHRVPGPRVLPAPGRQPVRGQSAECLFPADSGVLRLLRRGGGSAGLGWAGRPVRGPGRLDQERRASVSGGARGRPTLESRLEARPGAGNRRAEGGGPRRLRAPAHPGILQSSPCSRWRPRGGPLDRAGREAYGPGPP